MTSFRRRVPHHARVSEPRRKKDVVERLFARGFRPRLKLRRPKKLVLEAADLARYLRRAHVGARAVRPHDLKVAYVKSSLEPRLGKGDEAARAFDLDVDRALLVLRR